MKIKKMILTGIIALLTASAHATPVVLNLVTDDFPEETWFEILDSSNRSVAYDSYTSAAYDRFVGPGAAGLGDGYVSQGDSLAAGSNYTFNWDLASGDYTFMLFDTFRNDLCCSFGSGSYELVVGGMVVGRGSDFGPMMLERFSIRAAVIAESGMLALFGIGLIGLGLARRKA